MKKTILLSYLALFIVLGFPLLLRGRALPEPEGPDPSAAETPAPETSSAPAPLAALAGKAVRFDQVVEKDRMVDQVLEMLK